MERQLNMINDYDAENAKRIIFDDVNVTHNNPLKELFKLLASLALILIGIYGIMFVTTDIIIRVLPIDKQIALEDVLANMIHEDEEWTSEAQEKALKKARNNVLKADPTFPKTSNLNMFVIDNDGLNALCYPNGNIYITSGLYNKIKNEEQLTFVIAHEMGHYKHKDHLMQLRRNVAGSTVMFILALVNPNDKEIAKIAENIIDWNDLSYSRRVEENADTYAIKIANKLYGDAESGVEVMKILDENHGFDIEFLSTHPNIPKRIENIRKKSNKMQKKNKG